MFPELVTRGDLEVFLPPIGGATVYMFGDVASIPDRSKPLAVRVHDECNGSDVFGSDICTCRPYLTHGIEECVRTAQEGGSGVIVYNRKEGRALGEVTKFLVYNARKRQDGGDRAEQYFARTECVAGVQDMRFQELMPDVLHWLGITKIDRFVSMSNMKYDAIVTRRHRDRHARPDPRRADSRPTLASRWTPRWRPATSPRAPFPTATSSRRPRAGRSRYERPGRGRREPADAELRYLRSPRAIRERCEAIYALAVAGRARALVRRRDAQLDAIARRVVRTTRAAYPDVRAIPGHSRWRHFAAGGVDRVARARRAPRAR